MGSLASEVDLKRVGEVVAVAEVEVLGQVDLLERCEKPVLSGQSTVDDAPGLLGRIGGLDADGDGEQDRLLAVEDIAAAEEGDRRTLLDEDDVPAGSEADEACALSAIDVSSTHRRCRRRAAPT